MDFAQYARFFFALAFVIGLIWALSAIVKRFGLDQKIRGVGVGGSRLKIIEVLYLDPKRKLTLVRADQREYLILLSGEQAHIVDNFEAKP